MPWVLKPGGTLAVAVWDAVENIPAYAAEISLLDRIVGRRAADALRAPFVLGHRELLAGLFEDAGAGSVTISTRKGVAQFPGIRVMVEADLKGWLPVMGVNLSEDEISRVLEEAENVLSGYTANDGRVTFDVSAHLVTAKKP